MRFPWQKKKPALNFLGDLVKVTVAPGDVFVVMPKRQISQATADALQQVWEERFGHECPLVVLEEGMRIGVLSPEKAAAAQKTISEIEEAAEAVDQFASSNGA
jgi:hypothetical protein